jgi:serine phosphatase RsbU (regulator of sigma subunit)
MPADDVVSTDGVVGPDGFVAGSVGSVGTGSVGTGGVGFDGAGGAEGGGVSTPAPRTPPEGELLLSQVPPEHDPAEVDLPAGFAVRLAAVATREEVLDVVAEEAVAALGAQMVNISVFEDGDPTRLRLIRARATPSAVAADFATYDAYGPYPSADCLRTGQPVLLRSLAERDARYPSLAGVRIDLTGFAVLPIPFGDRALGILGIGWREPQAFPAAQVAVLEAIATLCGTALARADLYRAEQQARRSAERLAERLAVLQQLTTQLAAASDESGVAEIVISTAMDAFGADAATVAGIEPGGQQLRLLASRGIASSSPQAWARSPIDDLPLARDVVRSARPVFVTSFTDRDARYPEMADAGVAQEAWANLPLTVHDRVVGVAAFGWSAPRSFSDEDAGRLSTLAAHTAIALDRAQLLSAAQTVAETLQRALLPGLTAEAEGWQLAARYAPAVEGTQVGGDWYDAFTLPDGRIGLALGDVMGKGVQAAAVMGSVRAALRAFATVDASPDVVLAELDAYLAAFGHEEIITCCYAVLTPATGEVVHANAGHLPPLVVSRSGARWLDELTSPPLGVGPASGARGGDASGSRTLRTTLAPGEVLLLYSDGLVEDRHRPLADGLDALRTTARRLAVTADLDRAVRGLVQDLTHGAPNVDDLALLAVRRSTRGRRR